jgi:uncharacterized protein (TIGR03435 family)
VLFTLATIDTQAQGSQAESSSSSSKHKWAFDVVSIRPDKSGAPRSGAGQIRGDLYLALGFPIGVNLANAFFPLMSYPQDRFIGLPDWVWDWDTKYDFVGKVSQTDFPEWQKHYWAYLKTGEANTMVQEMLQTALAERCHLVVHRVPAQTPGYALVVNKRGPNWKNLKASSPDEPIPTPFFVRLIEGGVLIPILPDGPPVLKFYKSSLSALAHDLSGYKGVPVEDRTGLTGKFDFEVPRWQSDDGSYEFSIDALGLKLVPIMVPTESIVVDHIERPSPN